MKAISAVEFRNRQMQTRVLEPCPVCNELAEGVKPREFTINWWSKRTRISCLACVKRLEEEFSESVVAI